MSTIQTNRSGLIHVLTEMQVFRDQIATQVQFKQENYIDGGSVIAQRRCPEEIFFRNPYPTNIQTCGSSLVQLVMQMHVFRGKIFPGG